MEVVERLEQLAIWHDPDNAPLVAEIERLTMLHDNAKYWEAQWLAEIERLQALLTAKTTPGYELLGATLEKLSARIDAKEADNERLRAALQALHDWFVEYARINNLHNDDGTPAAFHELLQARAALEPKP